MLGVGEGYLTTVGERDDGAEGGGVFAVCGRGDVRQEGSRSREGRRRRERVSKERGSGEEARRQLTRRRESG